MRLIATCLAVLVGFAAMAAVGTPVAHSLAATGYIASVDAMAKSVVVKVGADPAKAHELTLVVAETSKLMDRGRTITLDDLKQGDRVSVTYKSDDGKNVVIDLVVQPKS